MLLAVTRGCTLGGLGMAAQRERCLFPVPGARSLSQEYPVDFLKVPVSLARPGYMPTFKQVTSQGGDGLRAIWNLSWNLPLSPKHMAPRTRMGTWMEGGVQREMGEREWTSWWATHRDCVREHNETLGAWEGAGPPSPRGLHLQLGIENWVSGSLRTTSTQHLGSPQL